MIKKILFIFEFLAFFVFVRLSTLLIKANKIASNPNSILYLENFPIENAGYQYRAKKWADLLNKDSFNCEVLTILESKSEFDNAYNGKIKRFEAKMAAYRVHLGGVFSLKQKNMSSKESFNFWRKQLNGYYHILKNYKLNLKQKRFINKAIYSLINILRIYAFQDNDISAAKQLALKQIKYTPKRGFNLKILIGAIASLIIPKYMAKRINTNKAKFS